MKPRDIVILSTADWDNPFWTNKQHVAMELARLGNRILYIDSLGLRRPSAKARDLRRIGRRLGKLVSPPRRVEEHVWVWSPIVLPWHGNAPIRRLNRKLFGLALALWLKRLRFRHAWLWTYNPITPEFCDLGQFDFCVYHCVDEIKAQPRMPADLISRAEEGLSRSADIVFTTSPALTESRREWNPNTHFLPNVADFDHFSKALSPETRIPDDLSSIPEPRVGFIGAISQYKVDFDLIRIVAEKRPSYSIVLIGSVGEGDPWTTTEQLDGLSNVHLLGPRPYDKLPQYLRGFGVAILPSRVNSYTESMFPMKFFEYLAAGRKVVSVDLSSVRSYAHVASLASNPEEFVALIDNALAGKGPPVIDVIEVARKHTYRDRTRKMLELISEQLERRR